MWLTFNSCIYIMAFDLFKYEHPQLCWGKNKNVRDNWIFLLWLLSSNPSCISKCLQIIFFPIALRSGKLWLTGLWLYIIKAYVFRRSCTGAGLRDPGAQSFNRHRGLQKCDMRGYIPVVPVKKKNSLRLNSTVVSFLTVYVCLFFSHTCWLIAFPYIQYILSYWIIGVNVTNDNMI